MEENDIKSILGDDYKEELTAEQKLDLVGAKLKAQQEETAKYKKSFDTASTDIAKLKKEHEELTNKYNASLSADEVKRQEEEAKQKEFDDIIAQNKELTTKIQISEYAKTLVADGCEEKLANEIATSLAKGETEQALKDLKKYTTAIRQQVVAEEVKQTPTQPTDANGQQATPKTIRDLSWDEAVKLHDEDPAEYSRVAKNSKK